MTFPLSFLLSALVFLLVLLLGEASSGKDRDNDTKHHQPLKIIGAGLGRTGTGSLQAALEMLGFKTYHMKEVCTRPGHLDLWYDLAQGRTTPPELFDVLSQQGYNASLDNPASDYFEEQLALYPNAQVILSVRDTPQKWVKSWRVLTDLAKLTEEPFSWSFPNLFPWIPWVQKLSTVRCHMGTNTMDAEPCDLVLKPETSDEWLAAQYEKHNRKVREIVPPDQLLVFNAKNGWAPLCEFLDLPSEQPCPPSGKADEPFPWIGDTQTLNRIGLFCRVVIYGWIPTLILVMYYAVALSRCLLANGAKKARQFGYNNAKKDA